MPLPDYYELLGITPDYDWKLVQALRVALNKRYGENGPEANAELVARLNDACDVLGHEDQRAAYDRKLAAQRDADDAVQAEARDRESRAAEARRQRARGAADAAGVRNAYKAQGAANPGSQQTSRGTRSPRSSAATSTSSSSSGQSNNTASSAGTAQAMANQTLQSELAALPALTRPSPPRKQTWSLATVGQVLTSAILPFFFFLGITNNAVLSLFLSVLPGLIVVGIIAAVRDDRWIKAMRKYEQELKAYERRELARQAVRDKYQAAAGPAGSP